jgi:uncharacterized protein YvpB
MSFFPRQFTARFQELSQMYTPQMYIGCEFVSVNINALSFVIFQVWIHNQTIEVKRSMYLYRRKIITQQILVTGAVR